MVANVLGGIGLFLLGMILMTDGLKSLAGDALRGVLARFTGSPFTALLTGAGVTALVQSSSATTLATIGFVSAGLLQFPQAVGVIFGANVGTTSTSWLVSILGLKLNIAAAALPLVGIGALAKLLGKGRASSLGITLAGFGLVFVGIDTLQVGMAALSKHFDPSMFPGNTVTGRLLLVLIGLAMTVVMQSSSAAAATTLTALHAGAIGLPQAAALVIGQNLGTTVTAGVASIGASASAKRTALAHVLFNAITGVVAFAILPVFVHTVDALTERFHGTDDTMSLAVFHTAFNVLGIAILMPFIRRFSLFVERVVPERGSPLVRHLDPSVVTLPAVAVEAGRRALREVAASVLDQAHGLLTERQQPSRDKLDEATRALVDIRRFFGLIRGDGTTDLVRKRHLSALHALDHLDRLCEAMEEAADAASAAADEELAGMVGELATALEPLLELLGRGGTTLPTAGLARTNEHVAKAFLDGRTQALEKSARGELETEVALARIDAMRWLDRVSYHVARLAVHLDEPPSAETTDGEQPPRSEVYPGVDRTRRPSDPGSGSSGSARSE